MSFKPLTVSEKLKGQAIADGFYAMALDKTFNRTHEQSTLPKLSEADLLETRHAIDVLQTSASGLPTRGAK